MLKHYVIDPKLDLDKIVKELDNQMIKGIDYQTEELRSKEEIYEQFYFCAWCEGVFERSTDKRIDNPPYDKHGSHTICPNCKMKAVNGLV